MGKAGSPLLRPPFAAVPLHWLSVQVPDADISHPANPNVRFIMMKTPLPESFTKVICKKNIWTANNALASAKCIVPDCGRFVAVNVSSSNEVLSQDDWNSVAVPSARVIVKEYGMEAVDAFCSAIEGYATDEVTTFLVYSGRGTNRPAFCISGYLARKYDVNVNDAIDVCFRSNKTCIYKKQTVEVLVSLFGGSDNVKLADPSWLDPMNETVQVGNVPLDLVQRTRGLEKISRRAVGGQKGALPPGEERDTVLDLVRSATENWEKAGEGPDYKMGVFGDDTLAELKLYKHYCTFEPRGYRGFIVVVKSDEVYFVDEFAAAWRLKVKADSKKPAVATAICVLDKKRRIMLLTDLLILGSERVADMPLDSRLSYLAHRFIRDLKVQELDDRDLSFIFRPMCELKNIGKLRADLSGLVMKCNGIGFYDVTGASGHATLLPVHPTVELQTAVNGGKLAVLVGTNRATNELHPVGIWSYTDSKMNGLDLRTSRFEYISRRKEWQPTEIGMNDPPSDIAYVLAIEKFMNTYTTGNKDSSTSADQLLRDIERISYD